MCAEIRSKLGQNTQHPANKSFLKFRQIPSVFTLLLFEVTIHPTFNVAIIQNGLVRTNILIISSIQKFINLLIDDS